MLVAAAIWSAVVLLVAGWSLQAFYRAETDRQLDLANSDTLRTLANAVDSDDLGEPEFNEQKLPKDEKGNDLLGSLQALMTWMPGGSVTRVRQSQSFFEERPGAR